MKQKNFNIKTKKSTLLLKWIFIIKIKSEQVYKPGSVLNGHLSWYIVANVIMRPYPKRDGQPLICFSIRPCFRWGLHSLLCYHKSGELLPRLSILTACWGRRSISVALSLGSPPAAVSSCHASVKPGLSSGRSSRPAVVCSTRLCIIIPYFCIICNCCFFVL